MKHEVISTPRSSRGPITRDSSDKSRARAERCCRSNEAHFSKKSDPPLVGGYRFERGSSVLKTVKFAAAAPTLSVKIVVKREDFPERDRSPVAAVSSASRLRNSPNAPSAPNPLRDGPSSAEAPDDNLSAMASAREGGTARAPFRFGPRR